MQMCLRTHVRACAVVVCDALCRCLEEAQSVSERKRTSDDNGQVIGAARTRDSAARSGADMCWLAALRHPR
jgi:hypothetical protein